MGRDDPILGYLNGTVYQSRFRSGLLLLALDVVGFVVGLHWGLRGVATAYALTNTFLIAPTNLLLVRRLLRVFVELHPKRLRALAVT